MDDSFGNSKKVLGGEYDFFPKRRITTKRKSQGCFGGKGDSRFEKYALDDEDFRPLGKAENIIPVVAPFVKYDAIYFTSTRDNQYIQICIKIESVVTYVVSSTHHNLIEPP